MSELPIQQGGLRIFSGIVPASSASTYGTHYSYLGIGGYVEAPNIEYRNSIPADSNMNDEGYSTGRRRYGMSVYVINEDKLYRLFPYSGGSVVSLETFTGASELNQVTMLSDNEGWVEVPDLSVLITGGTYFSGNSSIELYDSTGGTVSITGITTTDVVEPGDGRVLVATGNSVNTFVAQSDMVFKNSTLSITGDTFISTTGGTKHASAILHLDSKTKGLLFPVLTTAEKEAIQNPTSGLTVYDSTLEDISVYTSSGWTGVIAERDNLQKVTERGNSTNRGLSISGTTIIVGSGSTSATNNLIIRNSNNQTLFVAKNDGDLASSGPLTIGTSTSQASGNETLVLFRSQSSTRFRLGNPASSQRNEIVFSNSLGGYIQSSGDLLFATNNIDRVRIDKTTGNLSVGTTTDLGYTLSVSGNTFIKSSGTTTGSTFVTSNSANTQTFTIKDNGNVLIGTTTDGGEKLYVNGNTSVNGNLQILNNGGLTFYNGGSIFSSHYITTSNELLTANSNNTHGAWKFNNYYVSISKNLAVGTTLTDFVAPSQTFLVLGSSVFSGSVISSGVTRLSGQTTIVGSGTTSSSTALSVQNLTGGTMVTVNNGGYVGIGTTTPTRQLEIVQTQLGNGSLDGFFVRDSSNIQANFAIKGGTGASSPRIMVSSLSDSLGGGIGGTGLIVNYVDNNNFYPLRFLGSRVDFETTSSSYGSRTTIMRANPTGVLIGTTTDGGYMLDVNGTTRIRGANLDFINTSANFKLGYSTSKYTTFEAVVDGATKVSVNGVVKFFIGASSLTGIEIPSDYSIGFVNPGVAVLSNLNWNVANNQFEFKNGNKSLFADVMVGNFTTTGTTRMLGSGSTSGSTILTLQNSLSATTAQFRSDGVIGISSATTFTTQGTVVISATSQNSGIAIVPNGTGAITAQIPDGTVMGGNARGAYAVDLQRVRSNVGQVALRDYSVITGGENNWCDGDDGRWGFVGGGSSNRQRAAYGVIAGGQSNQTGDGNASNVADFIGGGSTNIVFGSYSSVVGGRSNTVSASYASIGGGQSNTNSQTHSTIVGGWLNNNTGGSYSIIGGGRSNFLGSNSWYTFIGSGWLNGITGDYSVIVGGFSNSATTQYAAVIGGSTNRSSGLYSLTHGLGNTASSSGSTAIGYYNTASGAYSVVMGSGNTGSSLHSTVSGGYNNRATGIGVFIGGGNSNTASASYATVVGGQSNTSSNSHAISGGFNCVAGGSQSVALGYKATSSATGAICIASNDGSQTPTASGNWSNVYGGVQSTATNTYASALGGYRNTASGYGSYALGFRTEAYLRGQMTLNGGFISLNSDVQQSLLTPYKVDSISSGQTTSLSLDGTGTDSLIIPNGNNRAWNVVVNTITVCTVVSGGTLTVGDAHSGEYKFLFKRVGGTSTISPITTSSEVADTSMATSSYTFSAGTSQQLAIVFNAPTTANNSTFRAVAKVQLVEVAW